MICRKCWTTLPNYHADWCDALPHDMVELPEQPDLITEYDVYTKEMLERDILEKRGGRITQLSDGTWAVIAA